MTTYDTLIQRQLVEKIMTAMGEKEEHVLHGYNGNISQVVMTYKESLGYLRALRDVLGWLDDVERELMGAKA